MTGVPQDVRGAPHRQRVAAKHGFKIGEQIQLTSISPHVPDAAGRFDFNVRAIYSGEIRAQASRSEPG